jgi:DNA-binding SARP family transcriptional activator
MSGVLNTTVTFADVHASEPGMWPLSAARQVLRWAVLLARVSGFPVADGRTGDLVDGSAAACVVAVGFWVSVVVASGLLCWQLIGRVRRRGQRSVGSAVAGYAAAVATMIAVAVIVVRAADGLTEVALARGPGAEVAAMVNPASTAADPGGAASGAGTGALVLVWASGWIYLVEMTGRLAVLIALMAAIPLLAGNVRSPARPSWRRQALRWALVVILGKPVLMVVLTGGVSVLVRSDTSSLPGWVALVAGGAGLVLLVSGPITAFQFTHVPASASDDRGTRPEPVLRERLIRGPVRRAGGVEQPGAPDRDHGAAVEGLSPGCGGSADAGELSGTGRQAVSTALRRVGRSAVTMPVTRIHVLVAATLGRVRRWWSGRLAVGGGLAARGSLWPVVRTVTVQVRPAPPRTPEGGGVSDDDSGCPGQRISHDVAGLPLSQIRPGRWLPGPADDTVTATSPGPGEKPRRTEPHAVDGAGPSTMGLREKAAPGPKPVVDATTDGPRDDVDLEVSPAPPGHGGGRDQNSVSGPLGEPADGAPPGWVPHNWSPHDWAPHDWAPQGWAPQGWATELEPGREAPNDGAGNGVGDPHLPLAIRVLGPPRVLWRPVPGPPGGHVTELEITGRLQPRARELLVYLALHPQGTGREALAATLWPDSPPGRVTNALNTALTRLRQTLSRLTDGQVTDTVLNVDGRLCLDPAVVDTDYWHFDAAVSGRRSAATDTVRLAAHQAVVDSYGGELAEGMALEWIEPAREAVRRDAIDSVAALARALVVTDPQHTLDLLEIARAFDPYNELVYRDVMRLQERLGLIDAIPRTLALLATRLTEIGNTPSAETTDLAGRLQDRGDREPANRPYDGDEAPGRYEISNTIDAGRRRGAAR